MAGKNDKIKDCDRKSILVEDMGKCFFCGQSPTHIHEVFGGPFRQKSKEYGLCVGLCPAHHNMSNIGVHFNKILDEKLKRYAEIKWIKTYCDGGDEDQNINFFIETFGINYL